MSFLDENGRPLIAVFTCWNDSEADIVVSLLGAHDIQAMANSDVPHSVLPLTMDGLGKIQVLVSEDDAEQARALLAEAVNLEELEATEETAGDS
jgi:hypothetical protein